MKKSLLLLVLLISIFFCSCTSEKKSISSQNSINSNCEATTTSEVSYSDITSGENSNISKIDLVITKSAESEQNIVDLGLYRGKQLQDIYRSFLNFGGNNLCFKINSDKVEQSTIELGDHQGDFPFFKVESNIYKSYKDLYDYLITVCTPDFSNKLLTNTSNIYKDINGELYVCIADGGFQGYTVSRIDSYEKSDDTILFNCTAVGDDSLSDNYNEATTVHDKQNDYQYTFTLKKIDGKWRISDCSDIFKLVYTW